jgi:hypothetical protein
MAEIEVKIVIFFGENISKIVAQTPEFRPFVFSQIQNQNRLRSTVQSTDVVTILRGNDVEEKISSEDLVPGDLVVIPPSGCELNFDGVLISGTAIGDHIHIFKSYHPICILEDSVSQPRG